MSEYTIEAKNKRIEEVFKTPKEYMEYNKLASEFFSEMNENFEELFRGFFKDRFEVRFVDNLENPNLYIPVNSSKIILEVSSQLKENYTTVELISKYSTILSNIEISTREQLAIRLKLLGVKCDSTE